METIKKAALRAAENRNSITIIPQWSKNSKELDCIFSMQALRNCTSKAELYKYWALAVETQNAKYRGMVDLVFDELYPNE